MLSTAITRHLESEYPNEGCGLLLNDGRYIPCENQMAQSPRPEIAAVNFSIDVNTYLKYARQLAGIVHSHAIAEDAADYVFSGPSIADQKHQKATGVDWHVYLIQAGSCVDHYVFNANYFDLDSAYRTGIADEFSVIEHFCEQQYMQRENQSIKNYADHLQLAHSYRPVTQGMWQEGDIGLFGTSKTDGPTIISIYSSGRYHWRPKFGDYTCKKKQPAKYLYLRLRKS